MPEEHGPQWQNTEYLCCATADRFLLQARPNRRSGCDNLHRDHASFLQPYQMTNSKRYPSLKRFEEMGVVEREVIRQEGKPDKHLYHFTSVGQEILHDLITDFQEDKARREGEFYVRVTCFPLLTVEERLAILRSRMAVLSKRRANVRQ
ncbi:hypothetical protein [Alicyclobacillus fodiniaquatilis]|uniref:PadR family transcriptional regulator n=1 Tax=Alicyclobacillus fodiniaquatilis TaxID=1661150 RepID=A0ABW4JNW8_9BACL